MTTPSRADCDADALFAQGRAAYDRGQYADAATLLLGAYDCHADPALLFNAARAYDRARDRDAAIRTYERYLASSPTSDAASRARAALAALREEATREAQSAPATTENEVSVSEVTPEPAAEREDTLERTPGTQRDDAPDIAVDRVDPVSPRSSRVPGVLVFAGIGLASTAGAITLRTLAVRGASDAEDAANHASGAEALRQARRFDRAALATTLLATTGFVAAVVWARTGRHQRDVRVSAGLGHVLVEGAF